MELTKASLAGSPAKPSSPAAGRHSAHWREGCVERVPSSPTVSVILPTYQRPAYLPAALGSVVAQTYRDFEVIVSDNSACSETEALVASYGDDRLRYRHNGGNIGATANMIAACREASGQLISILHDDDLWAPTFLEELVPPLEADKSLALAFCDHHIMTCSGTIDAALTEYNTAAWGRAALQQGVHTPFRSLAVVQRAVAVAVAAVIRKSVIDSAEMPLEIGDNYDLWLAYLASRAGDGAYYCPNRLTSYRWHDGSITSWSRSDRSLAYCYDRFLADPELRHIRPQVRRVAGHFQTGVGISLMRERQRRRAIPYLMRGLWWSHDLRALAGIGLSSLPARFYVPASLALQKVWRLFNHRAAKRAVLW